jgi:hypothetical protein
MRVFCILSMRSKTCTRPSWSPGAKTSPPVIEAIRSRPSAGLPSAMWTAKTVMLSALRRRATASSLPPSRSAL